MTRGQFAAFARRALDLPSSPIDYFSDDEGSVFEDDVNALAQAGVTRGCGVGRFCPDERLTRGEMAAFFDRMLDLPDTSTDYFDDDQGSPFESSINALAAAGITKGCNPPANDRYCDGDSVSRGQLSAFLHRARSLF